MKEVLTSGAYGSNLLRQQSGDKPLPMSFNIFPLKKPPPTAPYVNPGLIKSVQCVTYVSDPSDRLNIEHTGFYVNVFP